MIQINVPTVNENPDVYSPTFHSDFAISFDAANPDGNPAHTKTGGPGVLGGPEYVTLLQREKLDVGSVQTTGFRHETFELVQYPNHTFYSFKNYETGKKGIVAFLNGQAVVSDTSPILTVPTYASVGATGLSAFATALTGTYSWSVAGGTSAITSAITANPIVWTAGTAGAVTFSCVFTNSAGIVAPASTPAVCTVVAVPALAIISGSAVATVGVSEQVTVVPQANCTYVWTASRGTITFGQGTPAMSYTPGAAGTNNVNCAITNLAGTTTNATQNAISIVAAPVVPTITAASSVVAGAAGQIASIVAQAGMTYLWTMSNAVMVNATLSTVSYTATTQGVANNINCTVSNVATIPATAVAVQVVQTVTAI